MIDGLALGKTTPGPLIMVVAFVGFVGGYVQQVFGADQAFLSGAVAASLAHLPAVLSFHSRGRPAGGVDPQRTEVHRAAVVGVILNLALLFG